MSFKRFLKSCAGNTSVIFALAAVPLGALAGAATDMIRVNNARTEVYVALDAAVLAGTQALMENGGKLSQAKKVAKDFYEKKIKASNFKTHNIKFKMNKNGDGIAAFGKIELSTSLLKLVGIQKVTVISDTIDEAASASASKGGGSNLEVALMLDATGSMCDDGIGPCSSATKLNALKTAASDLVEILLPTGQANATTRVAVVPFSTRVRVGPTGGGTAYMKKMTNLNPTRDYWLNQCTNWSGSNNGGENSSYGTCSAYQTLQLTNQKVIPCVADRNYDASNSFGLTDDAPGPGNWLVAYDGSRAPLSADSADVPLTSNTGNSSSDPTTFWTYSDTGQCDEVGENNTIMPLTNDGAGLKTLINGLQAHGATSGVLGTAFAWYMLSPKWKDIWPSGSAPESYGELQSNGGDLRKIAVLMSDGVYNTRRSWKGQDINWISDNALLMCTNMKSAGIEVFTVGFDMSSMSATEQAVANATMQGCASSSAHYYNANNTSQLKTAFNDIGQKLTEQYTRLTK